MDKFKMELTWHNCKTCPPQEDHNAHLVCTDGRNIDYLSYDKRCGFPFDESDLANFWWADLCQTVRNANEFNKYTQMDGADNMNNKRWLPRENDIFWHIDAFGNPVLRIWTGHSDHIALYRLGNCYHTEAEAKKDLDKWVNFYASDDVIEV